MKRSKIDTADTRRRIVSTASRLFLENGLAETGIAHIMAAAGLTQGGFYRHFDSKDQLIAEANIAANDEMFDYYAQAVAGMAPRQALDTVVGLYLRQSHGEGPEWLCPLPNLGSELRNTDRKVRSVAMDGYQRLVAFFTTLTTALGAAEPHGVADAIVSTMVGAVMLSRLAVDPAIAQTILDSTELAVNALLQPER
ncbi:TetR/AcrR family transcriptional regulator [Duganella aceris]|uniref:TetR/AcrR family transcriptional regulator n=1 Tax=Duganella aceris TaxID=2703883 RepID=A0ABX0FGR1_9BURK|nr:TetR/AcrR family transcriptional regulator [Duganella aceris]NGZ83720.1 TetR/AcrR family transcriptional regulator [Duganella aceris]